MLIPHVPEDAAACHTGQARAAYRPDLGEAGREVSQTRAILRS